MTHTQAGPGASAPGDRAFSEQLYRIRDLHIEVESILQSLAALQQETPCASCANVCCKEVFCRESMDSDFLQFVLGPQAGAYGASAGWYAPGSGCRLSHGRPLVCYEYFCGRFEGQDWTELRQLSRAFKRVYANAHRGQHILVVDDIGQIPSNRLAVIHERLGKLRVLAGEALRRALGGKLGLHAN